MFKVQTPQGPLTHSAIRRKLFTQISKAQFDKIFKNPRYIGSGTQGQVYQASYEGQPVAIKYFRKQSMTPQLINYIRQEIQSLDRIQHQNILTLLASYQVVINNFTKKFCIVTQFCQSNLTAHHNISELSDLQKLKMCSQLMSGIKAAHQSNIMHRDIKPDNILIKDLHSMKIKIADFGCSKMKQDGQNGVQNLGLTKNIGTPLYADPNIQGGNYSLKCDVYSAGLVIVYIFCNKQFFSHCTSREQLARQKSKFTKDTVKSARDFFSQFGDDMLSPQIKKFLVEIALFTLDESEKNRHSAASLEEYINKQIINFQQQELYKSQISATSRLRSELKSQVENNRVSFKKYKQNFEPSSNYDEPPYQYKSIHPEQNSMNKKNNSQDYEPFSNSEQLNQSQLSFNSKNSKETIKTADRSDEYVVPQTQTKITLSKRNTSLQTDSNKSNSNKNIPQDQSGFTTPKRQSGKDDQSPIRFKQSQNSFISSDSNQFESNWAKKQSASIRNSSRMFSNLKASSSILQSRGPGMKSMNSLNQSNFRQTQIENMEKTLDEREKLCSQMIRYGIESSNINDECQMMKKILRKFKQIKTNFEVILKICDVTQGSFTKEQRQCVSFLFHFMYAGKLKDLINFVQGIHSNLNLEYSKMSSKKRQYICQLANVELQKVFPNMKLYSTDLKKKVDLIKPKLSQFIRKCVDQVLLCGKSGDLVGKIFYRQEDIKKQTKRFIEQKQNTMRNEQDLNILKELNRAISRICI